MKQEIRKRIEEIYVECTKDKFFQDYQKEKFSKIIDIFSDLRSFKKLYVEYLDMSGTIYFTFLFDKGIMLEMGFYNNGDIVHSISLNGSLYRIGDDIKPEEMVEKMNSVLEKIN